MASDGRAMEREALVLGEGPLPGEVGLAPQRGEGDGSLVARSQQGDKAAFEELYVRHRDQMYTLCLNLCGDREEAQDLLQETFLRAYRALPKFRGASQFSTWLYRIAINVCRQAARRSRRRADPMPLPSGRQASVAREADPATIVQVRAALSRLRPHHRVVLVLRYMQSLSYGEMAELLKWSLPRVKVTLHRAKLAFKDVCVQLDEGRP